MTETATITAQGLRDEIKSIDLDSLIPKPQVADRYHNRVVGGFTDFDIFDTAMAAGHNVMLHGPTGTGKTFSTRAYAAARGLPWYRIPVNGAMDVAATIGGYSPGDTDHLEWHYGALPQGIIEGRGVYVFDEINMGVERNMARFYPLWDSGRELVIMEHMGEVLRIRPGSDVLLVAAYNPGYRGTRELSQALPNRFAFRMEFDYDYEIESGLVPSPTLLDVAQQLRSMTREIKTPVSTNLLIEFCEIGMAFDTTFAIENMAQLFPQSEIQSVRHLLDLNADNLAADLAEAAALLGEDA